MLASTITVIAAKAGIQTARVIIPFHYTLRSENMKPPNMPDLPLPLPLPLPDADALAQSARLLSLIGDEITAAGGWIPFHRYMERALYAPGLGYYSGGTQKFGEGGDFVTAPELSPLFGQTLAAQVAEIMRASAPTLIEVGAGSGLLAADLLCELDNRGCPPERYGILELSATLRVRQRETLIARAPRLAERVVWLDTLPETFSGVVLANEVLDAMPLHVIVWRDGRVFERGVTLAADESKCLVWAERPAQGAVLEAAQRLPLPLPLPPEASADGNADVSEYANEYANEYVSEINLAGAAWVAEWGTRLRCGALLLIDYGYPRDVFYLPSRTRGTLMCHYRHRTHDDPFLWPGLTDITASVDFTAMAEAGFNAGLEVLGFIGQGQFLLNCGMLDGLARCEAEGGLAYAKAAGAAQRLTLPREMGDLFKVLALGRGIDAPLQGFARGDRTHTL